MSLLPDEALLDVLRALRLGHELAEAGAEVRFHGREGEGRPRATLRLPGGDAREVPLAVAVDPRALRALALGDGPPG